jgi:hypothetical protein
LINGVVTCAADIQGVSEQIRTVIAAGQVDSAMAMVEKLLARNAELELQIRETRFRGQARGNRPANGVLT